MAPCEGCPLCSAGDWCPGFPGLEHQSRPFDGVVLRRSTSAPKVWPVLLVGMHLAGPLAFRVCGQLPQVSVAGAPCRPPATPYARATEPARRRERTSDGEYSPGGCRPRTSGCILERLGALIQQAVTYDGDIPRGRGRVIPGGSIRRRRGQQSRPPTRETSPAAQKCPHTRRMSPAATPECGASMASRATGAPTAPARPPTTTSGPHTGARSGQTGQDSASSRGGEAPSRGVRAPGPVDLTLAELTRPAAQCPQR